MNKRNQELIVATTNKHKVDEVRNMIGSAVSRVRGTHDWDQLDEVPETGDTFRENAEQKARGYHDQIGRPVLADDSGLCVSALDGRPGVHTARFAGPGASDEENNDKLLEELKNVPYEQRDAHFVCSIVLYFSDQLIINTRGECHGKIRKQPRGTAGFGYDPIFEPDGYDRTFAEMSEEEKDELSHRGDALQQLDVLISSQSGELWSDSR
jgi:XTP/dITP diphosphohydrolase